MNPCAATATNMPCEAQTDTIRIMLEKEITFDRFVRGMLVAGGVALAVCLLRYLSVVLIPFFVGWLIAYLLYPVVKFFQYRCHLRSRILSIIVTMALVLAVLTGLVLLVVPPTISEGMRLVTLLADMIREWLGNVSFADQLTSYVQQHEVTEHVNELMSLDSISEAASAVVSYVWGLVSHTFGILMGLFGTMVVFLYTIFLLMDYERVSAGWINLVPRRFRPYARQMMNDVERNMNAYFRGQCLIALLVGILFSIGFLIVGLPMAIGLGMFIGVLNLIPYLQIIGILPAMLCVGLRSVETGENFWLVLLWCFIVFLVVQGLQDMVLTPRIMGHQMGLRPAVILLSLSVWGALLGFLGLFIALPLTTLCLSYYRRYVLKEADERWIVDTPEQKRKRKK